MTHQNANGVTFIDDASFYKPNYNRNDLDTFAEFFREVFPTQETEYNLNLYGQEGRYYEHKSGDYRGAIQTRLQMPVLPETHPLYSEPPSAVFISPSTESTKNSQKNKG